MIATSVSSEPVPRRFLDRIEAKSRDYRSGGPIVIVAFGDSVTMGATGPGVLEPEKVYHHRFKQALQTNFPPAVFSVINAGIGGDTAADGLRRIERDVLRYHPDLVLVAFGLNNLSEHPQHATVFGADVRQIVTLVRSRTQSDIVLMTPNFVCSRVSDDVLADRTEMMHRLVRQQNAGDLARLAQVVRDVGREYDLAVADVYEAWQTLQRQGEDTTALLANGLNHPTGEAHAIAADALMQAIFGQASGAKALYRLGAGTLPAW